MGQLVYLEKSCFCSFFFIKAPESDVQWSSHVNLLTNSIKKQDKLADAQSLAERSNIRSNKASTKAFIPLKTFTLPFILFSTKNIFTKFIKAFVELT